MKLQAGKIHILDGQGRGEQGEDLSQPFNVGRVNTPGPVFILESRPTGANSSMDSLRTVKPRDRLILELMAKGGMRVGEVLKFTPENVIDQKLILRTPKSGKEPEIVFIPRPIRNSKMI